MSNERQAGWYWVKCRQGKWWEAAQWNGCSWHAIWVDDAPDDYFVEIGPRIPTPDEEWQCVPSLCDQEMEALARFDETVRDDGSFDIGKDMVRILARRGLIQHISAGRYRLTDIGSAILERA